MEQYVYREVVYNNDPEIKQRATELVLDLTQKIMDAERERRIITMEALRGYLATAAEANGGLIPVEVMHGVIDDVLAARK